MKDFICHEVSIDPEEEFGKLETTKTKSKRNTEYQKLEDVSRTKRIRLVHLTILGDPAAQFPKY